LWLIFQPDLMQGVTFIAMPAKPPAACKESNLSSNPKLQAKLAKSMVRGIAVYRGAGRGIQTSTGLWAKHATYVAIIQHGECYEKN
jgi:hypothetical protein